MSDEVEGTYVGGGVTSHELFGMTVLSVYASPSNAAQPCATCRHWRPDQGGSSRRTTVLYRGECVAFRAMNEHPGAVAYGDFETEADFGCTEHQPRPSEDHTP